MQPSLRWHTSGRCAVGKLQWFAAGWIAVTILNIGLAFTFLWEDGVVPNELSISVVLQAISGSWILIAATREEPK